MKDCHFHGRAVPFKGQAWSGLLHKGFRFFVRTSSGFPEKRLLAFPRTDSTAGKSSQVRSLQYESIALRGPGFLLSSVASLHFFLLTIRPYIYL